jgi:hypothetical protein
MEESNKITQEVNKFLATDFIKKVMYPLASQYGNCQVKQWQVVYVCVVYFMNLNKVCLKDNYPLSNIV